MEFLATCGIAFFFDVLGVNWRVQMPERQAVGNPHYVEPCTAHPGRSCIRFAAIPATNMSKNYSFPFIGDTQEPSTSGWAIGSAAIAFFPERPRRALRTGEPISSAPRPWARVEFLPQPVDIYREYGESCARPLLGIEAIRARMRGDSPLPPDHRTAEARLRGLYGSERGLRQCR